jgi:hypothetical protein
VSGQRRAGVGTRRRMTGVGRGAEEEAAVGWHQGRGGGAETDGVVAALGGRAGGGARPRRPGR